MGSGVWATHFIAMLAYHTPLQAGYDVALSTLSAAIAIVLSGVALWLALRGYRVLGGAAAGAMIGAMHFTGMAAFEGAFRVDWDYRYVAASIALGIAFSATAFSFLPRAERVSGRPLVVAFFVLAICGLHFTGMTAATLVFNPFAPPADPSILERQSLAIVVAAVTILLLGIGTVSAIIDGYLSDRNALEAARLRRYVSELETARSELQATTASLSLAIAAAAASSPAKSQLLALLSHDLRTPPNATIGFSEVLDRKRAVEGKRE